LNKRKRTKSKDKITNKSKRSFFVTVLKKCAGFAKTRLFFESSGIALISFSVFLVIALATLRIENSQPVSHCGTAGAIIASFLVVYTGYLSWSIPIVMAVFGVIFFRYRTIDHKLLRFAGLILFIVTSAVFLGHLKPEIPLWKDVSESPGGQLGKFLVLPLQKTFGGVGTTIILLAFTLISIIFLTGISYNRILTDVWEKFLSALKTVNTFFQVGFRRLKNRFSEWKKQKTVLKKRKSVLPDSETGDVIPSINKNRTYGKTVSEKDIINPREIEANTPEIHVVELKGPQDEEDEFSDFDDTSDMPESSGTGLTRPLEYELPDISLLDDRSIDIKRESHSDILEKSEKLISKLKEFNVEGRITEVCPGPVITRYEFEPAPGVKIAKVSGLSNDIALGMRSKFGLRIEPVRGKSTLGIEIPNTQREIVNLKDVLLSDEFRNAKERSLLSLPLGKDTAGRPFISDLKRMPHLLIAGATGSGKSVCINTLLAGLLFISRPDQLRLLLIDPKMLELSDFNGIPHLREPVITDPKKAPDALNWAVSEMERRFRLLADNGSRNIDLFNAKVSSLDYEGDLKPLPYLVIVIDELADLMLTAASTVEEAIQRLSQMARAAGIHLIIATQRPSVDVITGVIKANLPCRLAFQVASKIDSRTILDGIGAETLVGMGDSIFVPPGRSHFLRLHGAFVNENEIKRLVQHLSKQPSIHDDEESIFSSISPQNGDLEDIDDPLYEDAVRLVLESGVASISMLQRRLKVGHSRASRLIDTMELSGIVGPHIGSKTREILVEPEEYLERLNEIRETGAYD
jgi:DNA segregation ATPase FtsK/SpoIIIE, S-DNA-T family